jgi:hypothetical protein
VKRATVVVIITATAFIHYRRHYHRHRVRPVFCSVVDGSARVAQEREGKSSRARCASHAAE